jgi:hypothetical protein
MLSLMNGRDIARSGELLAVNVALVGGGGGGEWCDCKKN